MELLNIFELHVWLTFGGHVKFLLDRDLGKLKIKIEVSVITWGLYNTRS